MAYTQKRRGKNAYIPVLPLRGVLVFPGTMLHFDVGRDPSMLALDRAMSQDQRVFLVAQRDAEKEEPEREDLYETGTIAEIKQLVKLPGDRMRVLAEGQSRGRLAGIRKEEFLLGRVAELAEAPLPAPCPLVLIFTYSMYICGRLLRQLRVSHPHRSSQN